MSLKRILVVDDSEGDQFLAQVVIEDYNPDIKIYQAYDGQEALELIEQLPDEEQPQVIFLDINMPRMNGYDFLKSYEQLETGKVKTRVIVMLTSSSQEKDKDATGSYECVKKYFEKPMDPAYIEELDKNF